jgi:hypothetical protein
VGAGEGSATGGVSTRGATVWLLLAFGAGSAVLLLVLGSGLTFFQDEWDVILHRRGLTGDAYLRSHNEHLIVIPVVIYKGLLAAFGMESTMPFRIVATLLLLATSGLLFAYLRRRVGDWLALIAVVPILFLGTAWQDLLWPFQMSVVGAMAAGLGMLLALEWDDPLADLTACVLLAVSISFDSLGIAFAAAAIVDVALRRDRSRAYIPLVPLVLYAAWYLAYGRDTGSSVTFDNVATSPIYLVDGVASSLASLLGLVGFTSGRTQPSWEVPLLVAVAVGLVLLARRRPPPSSRLWVVAAAGAVFWILAGFVEIPGREPTQNRYQYVGAIFILLVVAELLRGVRLRPRALLVVAAVALAATISNATTLFDARDFLREDSDQARGELGGLQIARLTVNPAFRLTPDVAGTSSLSVIDAGPYFSAADEFGSPADTPTELERRPESVREQTDIVIANALPATLDPVDRRDVSPAGPAPTPQPRSGIRASTAGSCLTLPAGASRDGAGLSLPPGGATIEAGGGGSASLRLRRFATRSYPIEAGEAGGGQVAQLAIPRDPAPEPWVLEVTADQPVTVCGRAGG